MCINTQIYRQLPSKKMINIISALLLKVLELIYDS